MTLSKKYKMVKKKNSYKNLNNPKKTLKKGIAQDSKKIKRRTMTNGSIASSLFDMITK